MSINLTVDRPPLHQDKTNQGRETLGYKVGRQLAGQVRGERGALQYCKGCAEAAQCDRAQENRALSVRHPRRRAAAIGAPS